MSKPTDQDRGEDPLRNQEQRTRVVAMLDPGFREDQPPPVLRPRGMGFQIPSNREDIRNLKFAGVAAVIALLVFTGLEYKQFYEAAREAKHSAVKAAHDAKHSLKEYFK
jgi:hypothetical protein